MPNALIHEQSPYLLQHAHNPVNWLPWGDDAFAQAETANKPVIVSIGYAACHWCHVMEHESFEDEATAAYMNDHFICIKVDREEHPDVDHLYMDAVQAISGSGGWPLNVFVTPGRIPFYGGTYYPPRPAFNRPSWTQLMQRMVQIWKEKQDEVIQQSEQMVQYLTQAAQKVAMKGTEEWGADMCMKMAVTLLKQADREHGGFGNAPKFPGTMAISFLLDNYALLGNEDALEHALFSLEAMADGGIYDQLGGGFARYSTDRYWLAPHFEKMLYDNALLIMSYCDAYQVSKDEYYKTIVDDTIAFVERELKDKSGGYYCALDADSEGVEGKFYTFSWQDFNEAADEFAGPVARFFGVTENGNWEHTNILHVAADIESVANQYNVSPEALLAAIDNVKEKLIKMRSMRIRPQTDDKCLLSWNALMNTALSRAAETFDNNQYLQRAQEHMNWMVESFGRGKEYLHTWKNGKARIPAKLDDYAYLIQAMVRLGSVGGHLKWIEDAGELVSHVIHRFSHDEGYFYFTPANQTDIPVRKVEVYDRAVPSANAVMAENLWICGMCLDQPEWITRAKKMMHGMSANAVRNTYSFGFWARLIQKSAQGMKLVFCSGNGGENHARALRRTYLPNMFSIFSSKSSPVLPIQKNKFSADNLSIFVCSEEACSPPVSSAQQAIQLIIRQP